MTSREKALRELVKELREATVGVGNYATMRALTQSERDVARACADELERRLDAPEDRLIADLRPHVAPAEEVEEPPTWEHGVIEGLEYAARLTDRFKMEGLDLSPLADEIRKLKSRVFPQEGERMIDAPAEEVPRADRCWYEGCENRRLYSLLFCSTHQPITHTHKLIPTGRGLWRIKPAPLPNAKEMVEEYQTYLDEVLRRVQRVTGK